MTDGLISISAICVGLLAVGSLIGLTDRKKFSVQWLALAALLFFLNDAALTRGYGLLPEFVGGDWNWTGKVLALAVTLAIASHPAFGWKKSGLTLRQKPGSLVSATPVAILYVAFFVAMAVLFPSDPPSAETVAFQVTMPGIEEEPFYRGILLLALNEAFRGRFRALGIDWGWGAVLSCVLFGLAHAFSYSDGEFSFEPLFFALTAFPSFIAVWLREKSGSLLLPVVLHNFGNSIGLLV